MTVDSVIKDSFASGSVLRPDRALPVDPKVRSTAREIYDEVKDLPIISMHGHVPVETFLENSPFAGPSQLLITPDHYLCRMLYSQGYKPEDLGVGIGSYSDEEGRAIWRRFCENWKLFRGTPTRYWLEDELATAFGITEAPSAESAGRLYEQISATLAKPSFRPRELLDTFNIETISTTDPASCDLKKHAELRRQGWGDRILPTLRPDAVIDLNHASWSGEIETIGVLSGEDSTTYGGYLAALRERRQAFKETGALATDHGPYSPNTTPLSPAEAERIFGKRMTEGSVTSEENDAFGAHMLFKMAEMACDDGLVMQIHPGVLRNQNRSWLARYGGDLGYDIPVNVEFTTALTPLLQAFGSDPRFRCVVFTINETAYSRELAPMAGAYAAMKLGAPWWFIDSPDGMSRFLSSATETAGFYNLSGFVDDTRAFCSIPARHDLFRRAVSGYLARLVEERRLLVGEAVETARDLAYRIPQEAYAPR